MQLTPEQENRLQATEEALNAALAAVEETGGHDFDGSQEELTGLLLDGLRSEELSEDEFWYSVDEQTNAILQASKTGHC